ncbi:MAG TPA: endolytic transglycosylase MltG [Verrucomicrobiae bacterium]|nr:endolytic transglycosylase MltG [Verrucomicrobiae bacterium]
MRIPQKKRKAAAAVLLAAALAAGGWIFFALFTPAGNGKVEALATLPHGGSLRGLAQQLQAKKVLPHARLFVAYARLRGEDQKAQAGTYRFTDGMSASEILRKLVNGEIYVRPFTLPEGYSMYQAAELLERQGLFSAQKFLRQCGNRELLRSLGVEAATAEGYLMPSTYNVPLDIDEAGMVSLMVKQFHSSMHQTLDPRVKAAGLSWREVLTLASMIEKEAVVPAERPLISSVFHNRLRKNMRLQSDPTAVYGVRAFTGKVTRADILRPTSHNTYCISGLPPGPIGNPGKEAVEAALTPAQTPYLYFVAKKDGSHHFSTTLAEHNQAVRMYLKEAP